MEQLEVLQADEFKNLPIEQMLNSIISQQDRKTPLFKQVEAFLTKWKQSKS